MKEIKLKNILMLTIAGFVNAFGVTVFLAPVKLYDSGISGTSMLLSQLTPEWCSLSLFLLLLNIAILHWHVYCQKYLAVWLMPVSEEFREGQRGGCLETRARCLYL